MPIIIIDAEDSKNHPKFCSHPEFIAAIKQGNLQFLQKNHYPAEYLTRPTKFQSLLDPPAGLHAIHLAVYFNRQDIVAHFLKEGLDRKLEHGVHINSGDAEGFTPLHWAARRNLPNMTAFLLKQPGLNLNFTHPKNLTATTPLHLAARGGYQNVATLLLDAKAEINAQDSEGNTALHDTYINQRPTLAELLIARGAKKDIKNAANQIAETCKGALTLKPEKPDFYNPYFPPYFSPNRKVGFEKFAAANDASAAPVKTAPALSL